MFLLVLAHPVILDNTHHNRFTALFPGPDGRTGARRELLDFMVQEEINRGRHTENKPNRKLTGSG